MVEKVGLEPTTHSSLFLEKIICCERLFKKGVEYVSTGGTKESRTLDLLSANQALSQLSYNPMSSTLFKLSWSKRQKNEPGKVGGRGGTRIPDTPVNSRML